MMLMWYRCSKFGTEKKKVLKRFCLCEALGGCAQKHWMCPPPKSHQSVVWAFWFESKLFPAQARQIYFHCQHKTRSNLATKNVNLHPSELECCRIKVEPSKGDESQSEVQNNSVTPLKSGFLTWEWLSTGLSVLSEVSIYFWSVFIHV